jgi:microcin C transport system ATP-binding protein
VTLLAVENLTLRSGQKILVDDVSFSVAAGEILAIVGESGSGKTLSALSVLNLLPPGITRDSGRIVLDGIDVTTATPAMLRQLRGGRAGMIFQEPMSSLNPLMRVGDQIAEALFLHGPLNRRARFQHVQKMLGEVGVADPERVAKSYPHQLSGGQRQRIMIAMALANSPKLLIADEPTTALDVMVERQILDLIMAERRARDLGVLLITHDLDLVRRYADRVLVMAHGRAIETGVTESIFIWPKQQRTRDLLAARNFSRAISPKAGASEILRVEDLHVGFPVLHGVLRRKIGEVAAVKNVSFTLHAGETLALVGESGSGKSTIALLLFRLIKFSGRVFLEGQDLSSLTNKQLRTTRSEMQIVFQDPFGSLAPRMTVHDIIGEGLTIHARHLSSADHRLRIGTVLQEVGLPPDAASRYPHEFSGGQRQRIAIARALILKPKLLVLDEPTSALDVTVQAEILSLLQDLQKRHGIAYIFISHDLRIVRALAHRVAILQSGRLIEIGATEDVFANPQAAYTRVLMKEVG